MKTSKPLSQIVQLAISTAIALATSMSTAHAGNDKGNGGGLIKKDGEYITFTTAGAKVRIDELRMEDLPELESMETHLYGILMLPEIRNSLISSSRIDASRKYYRASLSGLNSATANRILAEYRKAINAPANQKVVIAAITNGRETFLFEPFFALKNKESREAILLHETIWSWRPDYSYVQVIQAEMEYEKCLATAPENGTRVCTEFNRSLIQIKGSSISLLTYAALEDHHLQRIPQIIDPSGSVSLSALLGAKVMNSKVESEMMSHVNAHLRSLTSQYPNSFLLRELKYRSGDLMLFGDDYVGVSRFKTTSRSYLQDVRVNVLQETGGRVYDLLHAPEVTLNGGGSLVREGIAYGWCHNFASEDPSRDPWNTVCLSTKDSIAL